MTRATRTFEFTAFTEADLLRPGDHNLGNCDKFVMPECATVEFSVSDNDPYLSGDRRRNERGDDRSGQKAEIEVEGSTFATDAKIYAEKIHVLKGSDGRIYKLVEIEIAGGNAPGTGDDFFTFLGPQPPAGTVLHIAFSYNTGGVPYHKLGAGEVKEPPEGQVCIDFETDAEGNPLQAGDNGELVFDGVTFTASRAQDGDAPADDAMIFDAANPTGGDWDLSQPAQGNVLIISEDGDSSDPDDNAHGGTITATLDQPSTVNSIRILDTEEAGGTVKLFAADGTLLSTVAIPAIPDRTQQVLDLGDVENVARVEITLVGSGAIDDFKFTPPDTPLLGAIEGRYFCDDDGDGLDNGEAEPGVEGRTVFLLNGDGAPVIDATGLPRTTTTAADGSYSFTDLPAGEYKVAFEADPMKVFVAQGALDDGVSVDTTASDVDPDSAVNMEINGVRVGMTAAFRLEPGETESNVDAGIVEPASLGDRVFLDTFGDGLQNDEAVDPFFQGMEPGVPGVAVELKDAATGEVLETQVTDDNGNYLFSGLRPGNYVVGFIPPAGFEFTTANAGDDGRDSDADPTTGMTASITLAPGENNLTVDAGLLQCGLIEGTSQADPDSPVGGNDLLVGCSTDDTILGRSGTDTLIGNDGDDILDASSFNDTLFGGEGNDSLFGGSENDTLFGGAGDDILDGDGEHDIAVFSGNFADATVTVLDIFTGEHQITTADGTDTVRDVEVLRFDDGDISVDSLIPGGSRDAVAAPAPGGSVNIDVLANDINISEGTLRVAQVNDGALGTVTIEADGTVTYASSGDFEGYDFFSYTVTNDLGFVRTVEVQVGELPSLSAGDPGVIALADVQGEDGITFDGTSGDDQILGGIGFDTIDARAGNDTIDGGDGNDRIRGGNGEDLLIGGAGDDGLQADNQGDRAYGGIGDDGVNGQAGDDVLFGNEGNDVLRGLDGDDLLVGGAGDDEFLRLEGGADVAIGGAGNDDFDWTEATDAGARDFIDGESGIDTVTIRLDAGSDAVAVQAEIDAYLATVAANAPAAGSVNDGSVLTDTFSFSTIELDLRNVEEVLLA